MDSPKIPVSNVHNGAISSATPAAVHLIGAYPMEIMDRMQLSAAALHHQQQHKHLNNGGAGGTMAIPGDDYSDARSSSVSSFQADSVHRADMELDMEMDDDRYSSCSEDSDLSVGKEDETDGTVGRSGFEGGSPSVQMSQLGKPRKHALDASITDDSSSSRPTSRQPSFGGDKLSNISVDDLSNDSHLLVAGQSAGALPIVRPSPTRLQEEFLRNSQLYAEELMKHQMNFMAATKGLQLNAVGETNRTGADRKSGFRPHIRSSTQTADKNAAGARWSQPTTKSELPTTEGIQFRGIHTHLNAISKITSALGRDIVSLTSPIESVTSRESSQSPPSSTSSANFNPHHQHSHQQPHPQHQHPHNLHQQMINGNLMHDSNLKFSIDNILKPGFGRRITDPLLKRNKSSKKSLAQQQRQQLKQQQQQLQHTAEGNNKQPKSGVAPIDLTPSATPASAVVSDATADTASDVADRAIGAETAPGANAGESEKGSTSTAATPATATASSSSSSSASPMVWPAWVYCTRYSDRPSSGNCTTLTHIFHTRATKPPNEITAREHPIHHATYMVDLPETVSLISISICGVKTLNRARVSAVCAADKKSLNVGERFVSARVLRAV